MKKLVGILLVFVFFSSFLSVNASVVKEERKVGSFSGVSSCCGIEVYITEGSSSTIRVEADNAIINDIVTKVKGGVLDISIKSDIFNNRRIQGKMKVYVSAKNLSSIHASSSSKIIGSGKFKGENVEIRASSAGDIILDITAEKITCKVSSGANATVKGSASYANISASSGSNAKMKEMVVNKADVSASSGSDVEIWVKENIKARASSGSSISYYGSPARSDVSSSSGANIKKK
ncbi:MAG: DUF2807 domain-containing protein [Dysgonomonas sp.]|nr:DUF2807 domain-containing protein [Dysgonomonas sp.]